WCTAPEASSWSAAMTSSIAACRLPTAASLSSTHTGLSMPSASARQIFPISSPSAASYRSATAAARSSAMAGETGMADHHLLREGSGLHRVRHGGACLLLDPVDLLLHLGVVPLGVGHPHQRVRARRLRSPEYVGGVGERERVLLHGVLEHHRRSEEHTSELQSRENLVCRLLLEK